MTGVTKTARAVKYRTFSLAQIEEADARECGICLACGALQDGCEPDARKIRCEACGQNQVHGANDIMTMGLCAG